MQTSVHSVEGPSVWRGPDMARRTDWVIALDDQDVAELDAALISAKARGVAIPALGREHFPLDRLKTKLARALDDLENGRGFVVLRGLPVERYSKADAGLIFWGIGAHFGPAFAQNAQGDMLGHVRDLGANPRVDTRARGYQSRLRLPFHNDSTDLVGLLCLRQARSGGSSLVVSSTAVHNEILARSPELARALYSPFCVDRRGEESAGQKPYYVTPCFNMHRGRMFVRFNRSYIESAQRFADVPRLTEAQKEALELMSQLCGDPAFCLPMEFQPGDMQFVCNYSILHSRTEYEDYPEAEHKRHLLRLWLRTPAFADLPAAFADRNADMLAWQQRPKAPVFDISEIEAELAH